MGYLTFEAHEPIYFYVIAAEWVRSGQKKPADKGNRPVGKKWGGRMSRILRNAEQRPI